MRLNEVTKRNVYFSPQIKENLEFFSIMDCSWETSRF